MDELAARDPFLGKIFKKVKGIFSKGSKVADATNSVTSSQEQPQKRELEDAEELALREYYYDDSAHQWCPFLPLTSMTYQHEDLDDYSAVQDFDVTANGDIVLLPNTRRNCLNGHAHPRAINIPSIPGDPSAELVLVECEVARVSAILEGLRTRSHDLKERINTLYSPFIKVLPPEIVSEIFLFCLPVEESDPEKISKSNSEPLQLGAVCTVWRRIAWSTAALWANVILHITSFVRLPTQVLLLQEWLSRSGQLPLSIQLSCSEDMSWVNVSPEEVMKAIAEYASRWRKLDVRLPSACYRYLPPSDDTHSLPLLQSLYLKPPGGQGDRLHRVTIHNSPHLTHLALSCLYLRSVKFQWEVLTNLNLESFYIDETLEMLRQTPRLVDFTLRRILGGDDRHTLPEDYIVLPALEHLNIVNDKGADLQTLISKITTPVLRKLAFASEGSLPPPIQDFVSLISRSACTLESLSFTECGLLEQRLLILLRAVPSLISFTLDMPVGILNNSPLTDAVLHACDATFAQAKEVVCLLPHLEELTYSGIQAFTWSCLTQMIHSRTSQRMNDQLAPSTTVSKLKTVRLCLTHSTPEEADIIPDLKAIYENKSVQVHLQTITRPQATANDQNATA
ncbi:hypothetical protein NLJ89_g1155 [Agrocybe chaxingu]|uniref:F-box domain-containing protein n=1 Tax=Agrocybe chaxingu TaxID=84603 RepID=A0A9W8N0J5_9AGAR|nr:hypothetical protein NLJ89_g1155 [Agrocybe chaxingu]